MLNVLKSQLSICVCVVCVNICSSFLSIFVLKGFCFFACLFCFVPLDSSEIFNYRNNGPFICDISANIFYQFDSYIFILLIFFHVKGFLLHVFKCINIFFYACIIMINRRVFLFTKVIEEFTFFFKFRLLIDMVFIL